MKKNPGQFPAGGPFESCQTVGSEVTLGANLQRYRVLVLELVDRRGFRSGGTKNRGTCKLLVEVEPLDFGRERQVLDRGPAGNHTELRNVEVRVTTEVRRFGCN